MADGSRIALSSAELLAAKKDADAAAAILEKAAPSLRSAIPSNAFGAYGTGIAAAGNALGGAFGVAFDKLARLARETGDGAERVSVAFERVEGDGAAAFRTLSGRVDG